MESGAPEVAEEWVRSEVASEELREKDVEQHAKQKHMVRGRGRGETT